MKNQACRGQQRWTVVAVTLPSVTWWYKSQFTLKSLSVELPASISRSKATCISIYPPKSSKESTTATHRGKMPQGTTSFAREGLDRPFTSLNQFFFSAETNQAPQPLPLLLSECYEKIHMDRQKCGASVSDSCTSEARGEVSGKRSIPPVALSAVLCILYTSAPINKPILQQGLWSR